MLTSSPPRLSRAVVGLLAATASILTACSASSSGTPASNSAGVVSGRGSGGLPVTTSAAPTSAAPTSAAPTSAPATSGKSAKPTEPVHISLINSDRSTYGVGMPVIAYFSHKIKSAKPLQDATTLTVNGHKANGAWYFESSAAGHGPIEAHFRMQSYWPAHAHIHIGIPAKGLSAGGDLAYDDSLTLDFSTGARNIATVDDATHTMTVTSDGKKYGTFPVSLGADDPDTRTYNGIKVIMEKVPTVCMQDLRGTYHDCGIKYDQRVTYSGEYLHSAPWNCTGAPGCGGPANNIGSADSSNGCTNLRPADAVKLYHFLRVGDVVDYPDANGPAMTLGAGYGDWNVNWGEWQTGGLVSTT